MQLILLLGILGLPPATGVTSGPQPRRLLLGILRSGLPLPCDWEDSALQGCRRQERGSPKDASHQIQGAPYPPQPTWGHYYSFHKSQWEGPLEPPLYMPMRLERLEGALIRTESSGQVSILESGLAKDPLGRETGVQSL